VNILFDLDGTLTDSGVGITRCLQHALARLGREVPAASALRRFVGPPLHETFAELLRAAPVDPGRSRVGVVGDRRREAALDPTRARPERPRSARTGVVGDRMHDVRGARANGVKCMGVLWGYGSAEELRQAAPDHLVSSMSEPCEIIGSEGRP